MVRGPSPAPPLPLPQVQAYLETSWIPQLKHLVHSSLMDVNKGWFNISEDSWEVYLSSKLRRLMELVRYAMQVGLVGEGLGGVRRVGVGVRGDR